MFLFDKKPWYIFFESSFKVWASLNSITLFHWSFDAQIFSLYVSPRPAPEQRSTTNILLLLEDPVINLMSKSWLYTCKTNILGMRGFSIQMPNKDRCKTNVSGLKKFLNIQHHKQVFERNRNVTYTSLFL